MMCKAALFTILFHVFSITIILGQGQGNIWCFGDSAGIDFNNSLPYTNCVIDSTIEACSSISDKNGNLLFYTNGITVWNANHKKMKNGTGLLSHPTITQGVLIIPFPFDSLKYYIFTSNQTSPVFGFYYSVVDMSLDTGLGGIIAGLKNIELLNFFIPEKLTAVKHGNGKNWWVLLHGYDSNTFYKFIVTNGGVMLYATQNIGSYHFIIPPSGLAGGGMGEMKFSPDGSQLAAVNVVGVIDIFNFDRCTGQLSNWKELGDDSTLAQPRYYGCEFSANSNLFYISIVYPINEIIQFDLNNDILDSIKMSKQVIWQGTNQENLGQLQLAPDNKIYVGSVDVNDTYPSTVHSFYNENLTVINFPDSLGSACNLNPHSFYLGGNTTMTGLPNIPNYNLGQATPVCDTTFIVCPLANFSYTACELKVDFKNNSLASNDSWYFWDFGDGVDDTVKDPTHTYVAPGTYPVFMKVVNTCGSDTVTQMVTVDTTCVLGISEPLLNYFKLYPNPNNGKFHLEYSIPKYQRAEFIIFDVMGRQLKTFQLKAGREKLNVFRSTLKSGMYFYRVIVDERVILTDKLLIIK